MPPDQGEVGNLALRVVALISKADHWDDLHQEPLEIGREMFGDWDRRFSAALLRLLFAPGARAGRAGHHR